MSQKLSWDNNLYINNFTDDPILPTTITDRQPIIGDWLLNTYNADLFEFIEVGQTGTTGLIGGTGVTGGTGPAVYGTITILGGWTGTNVTLTHANYSSLDDCLDHLEDVKSDNQDWLSIYLFDCNLKFALKGDLIPVHKNWLTGSGLNATYAPKVKRALNRLLFRPGTDPMDYTVMYNGTTPSDYLVIFMPSIGFTPGPGGSGFPVNYPA